MNAKLTTSNSGGCQVNESESRLKFQKIFVIECNGKIVDCRIFDSDENEVHISKAFVCRIGCCCIHDSYIYDKKSKTNAIICVVLCAVFIFRNSACIHVDVGCRYFVHSYSTFYNLFFLSFFFFIFLSFSIRTFPIFNFVPLSILHLRS